MKKHTFCAAAAAAVLLAASPLVYAQHAQHAQGGTDAGSMDMMSVMKNSNEKMMSMPMTGKPDIDFAMMMRMHHLAGIQMAEIELRDGKEAKTRAMAKKIIASQKKEAAEFEAFLAKHGHPVGKSK